MLHPIGPRYTFFFQIDIQGRCRTGKVMKYDPNTGHRIKDEAIGGRITWVHSLMKRSGALKADWELTQCLFGEHLLTKYPGRTVALVESEKTAVICSALMPEYVWLATGGKSQLGDKLNVLQQRTIIAFPDVDGYELWKQKASELTSLRITVWTIWRLQPRLRSGTVPLSLLPIVPFGGTRDNGTQNSEKVMNTQI